MNSFCKKTKVVLLLFCFGVLLGFSPAAMAAGENVRIYCNNVEVALPASPIIEAGRTLVPVRAVLEAMNCAVHWDGAEQSIFIQSGSIFVRLRIGSHVMQVEKNTGSKQITLDVPPKIVEGSTYLPIRAVVEEFGAIVQWNEDTGRIDLTYTKGPKPTPEPTPAPTPMPTSAPRSTPTPTSAPRSTPTPTSAPRATSTPTSAPLSESLKGGRLQNGHTFYYESEPAWQFPGNGSGYCWVCSYAMLLNDTVGNVSPKDVAKVNLDQGASGNYCYHYQIVSSFGAAFTPALSSESPYFEKYEAGKGATYINNPEHEEAIGISALKEALSRNPAGVLVRYGEQYPHTIVAVGYEGDTVYFNDPMNQAGGVNVTGKNGKIPFECTYPGIKGFTLGDITFIQAIKKQ